ncbi:hypothetical protein LJ739_13130 [Aestuariibacter halophilus]|uniref:Zinc-finger domain-containing protein n=1 Tax=Fluctibacter halophilus TaxID=226011 RepID=A0ABS8GBL4_9ALTE|nr:hypothetical protein [Aestuariibacter halophilus]MCC2617190.1 hypothetical protein [Aestuariibacter halophilus]
MNDNNSPLTVGEADLDSYMKGTLTPEETQAVEEYLMDNPQHLERLKLDALLQQHIQVRPLHRHYRPLQHTYLPLAAAVLLCLSLMLAPWQSDRSPILQGQTELLDLAAMRSQAQQSVQSFPIDSDLQQLTVLLSPSSFVIQPYTVEVVVDEQVIATQTLKPGRDGNLYLNLDASRLPSGTVVFHYRPAQQDTPIETQSVRFERLSD